MKLFLDSANLDEIKKAKEMGIISGVTTNPSLIAKEGNRVTVNQRIMDIVDILGLDDEDYYSTISCEVSPEAVTAKQMFDEGYEIYSWDPDNIAIKIPMTAEGLKACKMLREHGVKVNMTLIFSVNQALLAARAGATFVSPFVGRLDDIDVSGINLIAAISKIFKNYFIDTKIIAASIRNPLHVTEAALSGADIATVPYKVIQQMVNHPLTDVGIDKFKNDYEKVFGK